MADPFSSILSLTRAAVERYDMLPAGASVAVGVSGGKDSLVLLVALARLREFFPTPFSLTAITLDPVFEGRQTDYSPVASLCEELRVPYIVRRTRLWEVVFEERRGANPCSLCARMRRGALHAAAKEAGCSFVALGHHKNDAAETFLMNLLAHPYPPADIRAGSGYHPLRRTGRAAGGQVPLPGGRLHQPAEDQGAAGRSVRRVRPSERQNSGRHAEGRPERLVNKVRGREPAPTGSCLPAGFCCASVDIIFPFYMRARRFLPVILTKTRAKLLRDFG